MIKTLEALVKAGLVGLALQGGCQDSRAMTNQQVRKVHIEFVENYGLNHYERNNDYIHYSFTSPICPGKWEGDTFAINNSLYFNFSSECDGLIPLVGYVIPHKEECRQTYYDITVDIRDEKVTNRQAKLVINTIPRAVSCSNIASAYIPVNCVREE